MAYLRFSQASLQTKLTLGFPSKPQFLSVATPLNFSPTSSTNFRCKDFRGLKVSQRLVTVFATNPNSVDGKSPKEGSDVNETSNSAKGPPFLTILAGFFVFFVVCWSMWSIITWLISLIVNVPAPK